MCGRCGQSALFGDRASRDGPGEGGRHPLVRGGGDLLRADGCRQVLRVNSAAPCQTERDGGAAPVKWESRRY